jgi:CRISPR/Cas system-associated protein endoribonuclease Cas2
LIQAPKSLFLGTNLLCLCQLFTPHAPCLGAYQAFKQFLVPQGFVEYAIYVKLAKKKKSDKNKVIWFSLVDRH